MMHHNRCRAWMMRHFYQFHFLRSAYPFSSSLASATPTSLLHFSNYHNHTNSHVHHSACPRLSSSSSISISSVLLINPLMCRVQMLSCGSDFASAYRMRFSKNDVMESKVVEGKAEEMAAFRKFAVLVTGHASDYTEKTYGGYGKMLARLLGERGEVWDIFPVVEGKFPSEEELGQYEGFVLSGSRHDAHANDEWIVQLCSVLQSLHQKRIKMLGICFGHQVLCRALGGKTGRAAVGWEIGLKDITLTDAISLKSYGFGLPRVLKIFQTHRDQVLELPPGGEVLASSEKTGIEVFAVGDHVLGIQGHPEYTKDVLLDIIESRHSSGIIKVVEANLAKDSVLEGKDDKEILRNLCKSFLKSQ